MPAASKNKAEQSKFSTRSKMEREQIDRFIAGLKNNPQPNLALQRVADTLKSYPLFSTVLVTAIGDTDETFNVDAPSRFHCEFLERAAAMFRAHANGLSGAHLTKTVPLYDPNVIPAVQNSAREALNALMPKMGTAFTQVFEGGEALYVNKGPLEDKR